MIRKLAFLINPVSGTADKEKLELLIKNKMHLHDISFEIMHTNPEANYDFLVKEIGRQGITDVIVCGGDGSVNQVAGALLKTNINIGIVPMGSGNGLARAASIPMSASKALDVILAGNAAYIDAFLINSRFSCMLAGLGLDAQVAHDFAEQPARGLSTYINQTIKNFFKSNSYTFTLHSQDVILHTNAFFISIANSNQFGNNFTIAPGASLTDGLLDIVVVNEMSKPAMLYKVARHLKLGKPLPVKMLKKGTGGIWYFQTPKLIIKNPGKAPLHIDGEPCKSADLFEIEIMPRAFRLIQP